MPAYSAPGVFVNESPLTAIATASNGITSAAFFGEAARGPATPTLISDWSSYVTIFGALEDQYDLGYAVYHYFTNGGRACYVTRVVAAAAAAADATDAGSDGVEWLPAGGASTTLFDATASSPGTWGSDLTVQLVQGSIPASATTFPSFTVVIALDGTEVERWVDCEIDPTATRYVESVVNSYSSFITVSNVNPGADTPDVADAFSSTAFPLTNGSDGTVADADYSTALDALDSVEGNLLINVPGVTSTSVVSAAVTVAGARGDSFVIIDPDKSDTTLAEIQATAANFSSVSPSGYAAAYAPSLQMVDPAKSGPTAIRNTAPGGAIAGLYVRTEALRTVAKSPAGYAADIRGALAPAVKLTQSQVASLYTDSVPVNSYRVIPGAGVNVYGARTLAKVNPDKFIPVRRTLNYLKHNLKELTAFAVFEPNDARLWEKLSVSVTSFLGTFWRAQGLEGATSSEAFYVVCDSTNNTPGTIGNGEVHIEVGVALSTPAEFVVINLSQWSGGASSATEAL